MPITDPDSQRVGLCLTCRNMRVVVSDRGSQFYRCVISEVVPDWPKYPRLPVIQCVHYASVDHP